MLLKISLVTVSQECLSRSLKLFSRKFRWGLKIEIYHPLNPIKVPVYIPTSTLSFFSSMEIFPKNILGYYPENFSQFKFLGSIVMSILRDNSQITAIKNLFPFYVSLKALEQLLNTSEARHYRKLCTARDKFIKDFLSVVYEEEM